MKRVVNLWLALLAAYWLTRAGASSLFFGRVDHGYPALVELLAIPALQAAALAWATRQPGSIRAALGFERQPATAAAPRWRAAATLGSLSATALLVGAALAAASSRAVAAATPAAGRAPGGEPGEEPA